MERRNGRYWKHGHSNTEPLNYLQVFIRHDVKFQIVGGLFMKFVEKFDKS